jgi:hypothetical protein
MTGLRKTFVLTGAAAVAIVAFAQNLGVCGDLAKSLMERGNSASPVPPVVKEKADEAMTVKRDSAPMTDADRKASAAMETGSGASPVK